MILLREHSTGFALIDLKFAEFISVNRKSLTVKFSGESQVLKINFERVLNTKEAKTLAEYLAVVKDIRVFAEINELVNKVTGEQHEKTKEKRI